MPGNDVPLRGETHMGASLPRWQLVSTVTIAVLSVVSTLLGLVRPGHYPPELLPQFYVQDLVVLVVGVPALLLGLWYATRGSLRGRVVWLGALAYTSYMWASVGLQLPFNRFFLGYVVLFSLSLFTFVAGTVGVDANTLRRALAPHLAERVYAASLLLIACGLASLWLAELVPATRSGVPPLLVEEVGPQALVSHFVDLSVVVPALIVAGGWLWRRHPWGYVFAGVALVFGALLAPTVTGTTLVLVIDGSVTVPPVALVFTVLPAAVATVLAVTYLLAIPGSGPLAADERTRPT
jgi:hypothetical protein